MTHEQAYEAKLRSTQLLSPRLSLLNSAQEQEKGRGGLANGTKDTYDKAKKAGTLAGFGCRDTFLALAAVSPLPFELFAIDLCSCYIVSPTAQRKAPIKLSGVGLIRYMALDGSPDQSVGQNVNGLITTA